VCTLLAISIGLASTAIAEDRDVSAASGEPAVIGHHVQWKNKDCSPNGMPAVKIGRQPEHGAAKLTAGPVTIGANRNNPGQDQCRGKEMTGVILNYLSNPEFVGIDTVTYTVTMYGNTYSNTVTINVLPSATTGRKKPDTVVASANAVTPRTTQPADEVAKATVPTDTDIRDAIPTAAGNRIALVIGNSAYKNVPALTNPARDADTMASAFRSAGFKTVQRRRDLTREM